MKGKAEAGRGVAPAGNCASEASVRLQEPKYALPMVGRAAELARVSERLDQVLMGRGQIVGFTAEAGVGKSRLVAEVTRMAQARGLEGLGGECQSYGTNTSYQAWQNIWRGFFGLTGDQPLAEQLRDPGTGAGAYRAVSGAAPAALGRRPQPEHPGHRADPRF